MCKNTQTVFQIPEIPFSADFIPQIPSFFTERGTIIHNRRNQIRIFEENGQQINIKKYCIPPIVNRILYSLGWRTPKAKATYQNAVKILENGFLTPRPFGYILQRRAGLLNFSYFISEQIQNMRPMGYKKHSLALIHALAEYTADLHEKGMLHLDYTPNNILISEKNGKYSFALVDINRFRFYKGEVPMGAVLTNLMKPFREDEQIKLFVMEYVKRRGLDETLYKKVLQRRHLRNAYDNFKSKLKKIPLAKFFLNKPLGKQ